MIAFVSLVAPKLPNLGASAAYMLVFTVLKVCLSQVAHQAGANLGLL